jgi:hypothetical protein
MKAQHILERFSLLLPILENMTEENEETINEKKEEKKWSSAATKKDKWHPPEGFFSGSAESIAKGLKGHGYGKAMKQIQFFINRGGDNLSSEDKTRLEHAKEILRGKKAKKKAKKMAKKGM